MRTAWQTTAPLAPDGGRSNRQPPHGWHQAAPGLSGGAAAARLLDGARAVEQVRGADLHAGRQLHLRWRALGRHKHLPRRAQVRIIIE